MAPIPTSAGRILEVGCFSLFSKVWPERTDFRYAGPRQRPDGGPPPRRFALADWSRVVGRDLVVAHTAAEPTWRTLQRLASWRQAPDAMAALLWALAQHRRPRPFTVPLAVLDMHDTATINRRNLGLLRAATLYFKRELPLDPRVAFPPALRGRVPDRWLQRLRPISLGLSAGRVADAPRVLPDKTVDVFFAGNTRHAPAVRVSGLAQVRALAAEGIRVDVVDQPLPRPEFLARCARAHLVWSPEGLGWDCFRHYEAALCGAVPVINTPTIIRHAPLEAGTHALYYPVDSASLQQVIRRALQDRVHLVAMGRAARDHVLRHHTHAALCDRIVSECASKVRTPHIKT